MDDDSYNEDNNELENDESDDDTLKATNTKKKRKLASKRDNDANVLPSKMSPRIFYKMLLKLSMEQKNAVKNIRFGSILDLEVMDLPRRLGRFLVEKFDYCNSLVLEKGNLTKSKDDVHSTLGFHCEGTRVEEASPSKKNDSYLEFVKSFKLRWFNTVVSEKKTNNFIFATKKYCTP